MNYKKVISLIYTFNIIVVNNLGHANLVRRIIYTGTESKDVIANIDSFTY